MQTEEIRQFQALKAEVVRRFQSRFPATPLDPGLWTGKDIVAFQEELAEQVQGRVSEKWFYTHFKQNQGRLPRIDMLDLLSQYVGHPDWRDFQGQHQAPADERPKTNWSLTSLPKLAWLLLLLPLSLLAMQMWPASEPRSFCFVDGLTGQPISDSALKVFRLLPGESPQQLKVENGSCVSLTDQVDQVSLWIEAPYYRSDTLTRKLSQGQPNPETIALRNDDYARMIHYFSQNQTQDWQRRRTQLAEVFSEEAKIFQVHGLERRGMELYNKQEFIDQLTMPLSSLGTIEVLETQYQAGKIIRLTFTQDP